MLNAIEMFSDQWELYRTHISPAGRLDASTMRDSDIMLWQQIAYRKRVIERHKTKLAAMRTQLHSADEKVSGVLRKEIAIREGFLDLDEKWLVRLMCAMRMYDNSQNDQVDLL